VLHTGTSGRAGSRSGRSELESVSTELLTTVFPIQKP
jgi:hypothetical protein